VGFSFVCLVGGDVGLVGLWYIYKCRCIEYIACLHLERVRN